jgi:hypothetical protein
MQGGTISGNTVQGSRGGSGGGVDISHNSTFTLEGGTIYGKSADPSLANNAMHNSALGVHESAPPTLWVRWGTGGIYTQGGVTQTDKDISVPGGGTDETLIAIPAN